MSESLDEIRKQLDKLQQMLADQQEMGLPTGAIEARIAKLNQRRDTIRVKGKMVGSVAGSGSVNAENIAGRDIIIQYIKQHVEDGERKAVHNLFLDYLAALKARLLNLPMYAITERGAGDDDVLLTEVYTALNITSEVSIVKREGKWQFATRLPQQNREYQSKNLGSRMVLEARIKKEEDQHSRAITALEAAALSLRLVLLGEAGSGKSTFAKFLALCLVGDLLDEPKINLRKLNGAPISEKYPDLVPWPHGALLPIFVELRNFTTSPHFGKAPRGQEARELLAYLTHGTYPMPEALLPHFTGYLHRQADGALLILDGLDEVSRADQNRAHLREVIAAFTRQYPKCHILVTSRPYAYEDPNSPWRLDGAGFDSARLADFDAGQIQTFIKYWYTHLRARGHLKGSAHVEERTSNLWENIQREPYLQPLARRPLMLTMMTDLHHNSGGALPVNRAMLYDRSVNLLLDRWNEAREVIGPATENLGLNIADIRQALQELAYEVHHSKGAASTGTADITDTELYKALKKRDENMAVIPDRVMGSLHMRSGILIADSPELFRFPHRSYQEYLAARHLAADREFPKMALDRVRENPAQWREVLLLLGGHVYAGTRPMDIWRLLECLVPGPPAGRLKRSDARFWQAFYAALIVQEQDLHTIRLEPQDQTKLENIRRWLRHILEVGALSSVDRAAAGRLINDFPGGDDRPGVALTPNPSPNGRGELIPDIVWCEVPGGEVEIEGKTFTVEPFHIAKYPVTYKQFQAFIDAEDGYQNDRWWEGLARKQPGPYEQNWKYDNHPRERVEWYEAVAFCRWLSDKLGFEITLPTEWQWQQAATGGESSYEYPWGLDWKDDRANSEEAGIGQTSAVGMFPAGASPTGALDLAGNVWEWCANEYRELVVVPSPEPSDWMAFRGGYYGTRAPGCGSRYANNPFSRYINLGFRVVCARPHLSTEH